MTSFGQKITYNIPEGYENDISKGDYKKLVDLVIPVVSKRYTIDHVKDGAIYLKADQDMQLFNLHNLILKCSAEKDRSKWSTIVNSHFEKMFSSIDEQKKIDPANYETIKKYLSLRIYPKTTVEQRGGIDQLVAKVDLEGTYTLLMLDLPGAFTPVPKEMFEGWKLDAVTVFSVAQVKVNQQPVEKVTKKLENINLEISFLGNEDYAASYALDLGNNSPELVGDWGSVIAMPNKGLVDICKISKDKPLDLVTFIQTTKSLIEKSFTDHAQPISDQYFWYYQGKFTRINVTVSKEGNVNVISPVGLAELMTKKD